MFHVTLIKVKTGVKEILKKGTWVQSLASPKAKTVWKKNSSWQRE